MMPSGIMLKQREIVLIPIPFTDLASQKRRPAIIISSDADGSVTLLMPNSINKDNHIKPNKAYEFPPAGSQIRLKAMFLPDFKGKVAEERIKIIATKKREELVPLGFQEGMFKVYDAKSTGMISDLVKRLNQLEPADWAEATAGYRIER
jgi:hypothetical protein